MINQIKFSPLKHAFSECIGGIWGDEPTGQDDLAVVRVADFDKQRGEVAFSSEPTMRAIPNSALGRRLLNPGDLLLEKSGGGPTSPVGNVVQYNATLPAVCSNFIVRLELRDGYHSAYLKYVFQSMYARGQNARHYTQTSGIQNLNVNSYLSEEAWFPPLPTQTTIANYLDRKTAAIDALIEKKERLIEEVRKYQEAVIAEAVAPREGWVRMKLKQCVSTKISTGVGKPGTEFNEGDPRYLRTTDIESLFNLKSDSIRTLPAADVVGAEVMRDDILFTTAGSVGKTYHHSVDGEFCYAGFLARVRLKTSHCSRYFAYLLSSRWVQDIVDQYKVTSTIDNFSASKLGDVEIYIPPLEEQKCIASKIDQLLISSARVLENAQLSLQSLKNLRSSVISEAVTGKLPLPEEIQ